MKGYIYIIGNMVNNKIYIGQTVQELDKRFSGHKYDSKKLDTKFYRAMRKYGVENFFIEELTSVEIDSQKDLQWELNILEVYYINLYKQVTELYNTLSGGNQSRLGVRHSEQTKKKIGKSKYTPYIVIDKYGEFVGEFVGEFQSYKDANELRDYFDDLVLIKKEKGLDLYNNYLDYEFKLLRDY